MYCKQILQYNYNMQKNNNILKVVIGGLAFIHLGSTQNAEVCPTVCNPWEYCNLGKCQDRCLTTKCKGGSTCFRGRCLDPACRYRNCNSWEYCENGICIDNCKLGENCPPQQCFRGYCNLVDKCAVVRCPVGTKCVNGNCIKIQKNCLPVNLGIRSCFTSPRPTHQNCPDKYYFVEPPSLFCGVSFSGQLRDYPEECLVCREEASNENIFYYNVPCKDLNIECADNQKCDKGKCVVDPCYNKICPGGRCLLGKCY